MLAPIIPAPHTERVYRIEILYRSDDTGRKNIGQIKPVRPVGVSWAYQHYRAQHRPCHAHVVVEFEVVKSILGLRSFWQQFEVFL